MGSVIDSARSLHDIFVVIVISCSWNRIHVVLDVPELLEILAERLPSCIGAEASGTVLYIRILYDSLCSDFIGCRAAKVDIALVGRCPVYVAIVSICGEEIAVSIYSYISDEIIVVRIASYVFPIEVFFVVDGVILEHEVDFLYSEIGVLSHIGPCLDIIFESDHLRIDIDDRRQ